MAALASGPMAPRVLIAVIRVWVSASLRTISTRAGTASFAADPYRNSNPADSRRTCGSRRLINSNRLARPMVVAVRRQEGNEEFLVRRSEGTRERLPRRIALRRRAFAAREPPPILDSSGCRNRTPRHVINGGANAWMPGVSVWSLLWRMADRRHRAGRRAGTTDSRLPAKRPGRVPVEPTGKRLPIFREGPGRYRPLLDLPDPTSRLPAIRVWWGSRAAHPGKPRQILFRQRRGARWPGSHFLSAVTLRKSLGRTLFDTDTRRPRDRLSERVFGIPRLLCRLCRLWQFSCRS